MMKRKLLIFHPALAPYRIDFFNAIDRAYDSSFYFYLKNVSDQKFDQDSQKKKCTFQCNYLLNGFELFGRSFRSGIFSIIRKRNPEIILCSEYGPVTLIVFIYKIFFKKKLRLYTISDDSIDNSKSRNGFRNLLRYVISKNIDGVIFPSKEVCNWYSENISNKIRTFELPIIHNDLVFRDELTKSLNIANRNLIKYNLFGKKVMLFVGRLVEVKNLPLFIKVVSQLKTVDWNLVIVGEGVLKNYLIDQVKTRNISDKTYFVGRQEGLELYSWYTFAQIFILPSTYERFGAVVNEALLGGCKVLCSELAGASTLINRDNGSSFDPYNEKEFFSRILNFLMEVEPLTGTILKIRESRMPFSFSEKVDILLNNL